MVMNLGSNYSLFGRTRLNQIGHQIIKNKSGKCAEDLLLHLNLIYVIALGSWDYKKTLYKILFN